MWWHGNGTKNQKFIINISILMFHIPLVKIAFASNERNAKLNLLALDYIRCVYWTHLMRHNNLKNIHQSIILFEILPLFPVDSIFWLNSIVWNYDTDHRFLHKIHTWSLFLHSNEFFAYTEQVMITVISKSCKYKFWWTKFNFLNLNLPFVSVS